MDSILPLIKNAYTNSSVIRNLSDEKRQAVLLSLADIIEKNIDLIKIENQKDLDLMEDSNPKKDRLLLTEERIIDLVIGLKNVAKLPDPTGIKLSTYAIENDLTVEKISVPLGVIGVIYESRPNVTIDVASLGLRSGNAVILRGGSDAEFSNKILVQLIHQALEKHNIPKETVTLLPTDRKFVPELLNANQYIDIIIPRGSESLINFVKEHSKIPTIETGAGVCHTYIEKTANLKNGAEIVINAKTQRPSVCNALDTIILDDKIARDFFPLIIDKFKEFKVEIYADKNSYPLLKALNYPYLKEAEQDSFGKEYLGFGCSVKTVSNIDEALEHIRQYSSKHSEAIVTENKDYAERFLKEVDAAAVFHNASTRFTDGEKFGLGAEIGISTQKLHARGPFALEKLVTEKWVVKGNGNIRK